jgi:Cd2+/Zn2+-exporting ATPase
MTKYRLEGLDCPSCAAKIEGELRKHRRLETATVNFIDQTLSLDIDDGAEELARSIVSEVEPSVELVPVSRKKAEVEKATISWPAARIIASAVLLAVGLIFEGDLKASPGAWARWAIFLTAYVLVGWEVLSTAFKNLLHGRLFDEMFLMAIATLGAIALGELSEAVGVMLFYSVGEYLQDKVVDTSRRSISGLMDLRPEFARLVSGSRTGIVEPEEVQVGDVVEVRAGERVPLDGEVVEGESCVDTSSLTGESVPCVVGPGSAVLSGFVNDVGILRLRVTAPFGASAAARILALVQDSAVNKAPTEKFITKFASVYTPIVVAVALAIAVVPPLFLPGAKFSDWLYRALVLLVISCPCALVISIPLGYFGGVGSAAKHRVLIKGANHLDSLLKAKVFVFDKTGTLTEGRFAVAAVEPEPGFSAAGLLELAAAAESLSPHPIAGAIRTAAGKALQSASEAGADLRALVASKVEERKGLGVSAQIDGKTVLAGKERFLAESGVALPERAAMPDGEPDARPGRDPALAAATEVFLAVDGAYAGRILVADKVKPEALGTLKALKALGVKRLVMLTGDNEKAAAAVAAALGIDEFRAGLLPQDKVAALEELEASLPEGGKLVFVGDGMNDAPVLMRADLGIAMGGLGTDAAIEAADAVVMDDRLDRLPQAMRIASFTRRIVWENVVFSLGVKLVFLVLGAAGAATMWEAVIADVGVAIAAVLNSTRTLRVDIGDR